MTQGTKQPAASPKRPGLLRELLKQLVCPSQDFETSQYEKAEQYKGQKDTLTKISDQTLADLLHSGPEALNDEQLSALTTFDYASLEIVRSFVHTTAELPDAWSDFILEYSPQEDGLMLKRVEELDDRLYPPGDSSQDDPPRDERSEPSRYDRNREEAE